MSRGSWQMQLLKIADKGRAAFLAGSPREDCPYWEGYRNQNGAGGQFQRQRRFAWYDGWDQAKRESESKQ